MKFEIDIELPEDVLKAWEPVAFRGANAGEWLWNEVSRCVQCAKEASPFAWIILRRLFDWNVACPWLTCRYLVWDADGTASGWNEMPEMSSVDWHNDNDTDNKLEFVASAQHATHLGVAFPGGDWRTRIEENPSWSETDDA